MPKPLPSALGDGYVTYPSADQAAMAALRSIQEKHVETGGAVLFNPQAGHYAYTQPVGKNDTGHFSAAVQVPPGWQMAALFHTHPVGARSTEFSPDDIDMARQLKVPSYILPLYDGKVRSFDPASSPVSKSPQGPFAVGSVVEDAPPPAAAAAADPAAAKQLAQALMQKPSSN